MSIESDIEKLLKRITGRTDAATTEFIRIVASRMRNIGDVDSKDFAQYFAGTHHGNMLSDRAAIARAFAGMDKENLRDIKKFFTGIKSQYQSVKVSPLYKQVYGTYKEMAKSTATTKQYARVVGKFLTAMSSDGETKDGTKVSSRLTYPQALKKAVKTLADEGVKRVEFTGGKSMRMDSAVRSALMTEFSHVVQEVEEQVADEIGADGREISAHAFCADDHADVQGRIFTVAEFQRLQETGYATDVDGEEVEILHSKNGSFRAIGDWNCHHIVYPFLIGIDTPTYSKEYLAEREKQNESGIQYKGEHLTLYEGTQKQRQLETAYRYKREEKAGYDAAGLTDAANKARGELKAISKEYKELGAELQPFTIREKRERMYSGSSNDANSKMAVKAKEVADKEFPGEQWQKIEEGIYLSSNRPIGKNTNYLDEKRDAQILLSQGNTVYLVPEDRRAPGTKYDAIVNGNKTEFKNVSGNANTLQTQFLKSRSQAPNVFINLEHSDLTKNEAIEALYGARNKTETGERHGYEHYNKFDGGLVILKLKGVDKLIYLNVDTLKL